MQGKYSKFASNKNNFMYIPRHNNRHNSVGFIQVALIIGVLALFFAVLTSCNAEKKALKPYKAVNSDVDTNYHEKKKELISRVCAVNFPIQEKTIVKDSITTKIVRVQDNNLINKLKAQLAKGCPTVNIDSLYNEFPMDTIYVDRFHTKTITQKDTIELYIMGVANTRLTYSNLQLNAHIEKLTKDINEANSLSDKWRLRFWLLFSLIVLYFGLKAFNFVRGFKMPF